jgi:hypothetical protein
VKKFDSPFREGDLAVLLQVVQSGRVKQPPGGLLFWSGVFFGGALDHAFLALKRADRTPYGFRLGRAGNCAFAFCDAAVAAVLYAAHRQAKRTREA